MTSTKLRCLKTLRNALCTVTILILGILTLIHLPDVQHILLQKALTRLYKKTHYHIKCDRIRLTWLQHIALEGLRIKDPQSKPLLSINSCKGKLNLWSLLRTKPDIVEEFSVIGVNLYLEEDPGKELNIKTFYKSIAAVLPGKTRCFAIQTIQCSDGYVHYHHPDKQHLLEIDNISLSIRHFLCLADGHYTGMLTALSCQKMHHVPLVLQKCKGAFAISPDRISLKDCELHTQHSYLKGSFTLKHDNQEALLQGGIEVFVQHGLLHSNDVPTLIKEKTGIAPYFKALPYLDISDISCIGNRQKVQLAGALSTPIGSLKTDLIITNPGNKEATYQGTIALHELNIHMLSNRVPITALSAEIAVTGKGMSTKPTFMEANVHINALQTSHYTYRNIEASCRGSFTMMAFKIHSKDPHALVTIKGAYYGPHQKLTIDGTTAQFNLATLGVVDFPLILNTKIALNCHNIFGNHPQGSLYLTQTVLQDAVKKLENPCIAMHLTQEKAKNLLTINTSIVKGSIQGNFLLYDLYRHMLALLAQLRGATYQANLLPTFHIDYWLDFKDLDLLLHWFIPDLHLPDPIAVRGKLSYRNGYHFSLYCPTASTIAFKQWCIEKTTIALTIRHLMDPNRRLVQLSVDSEKQKWHQSVQTDKLALELLIDKNAITVLHSLAIPAYHSTLSLACSGTLNQHGIAFHLLPTSSLKIREKIWTIQMKQPSLWTRNKLSIGNLSITNGCATIFIGGTLTEEATENPLHCTIHNVALTAFAKEIKTKFQGLIHANLVTRLQHGRLIATGAVHLQKCSLNHHLIGSFKAKVDWHTLDKQLTVDGILQHGHQPIVQINGSYSPFKKQDHLHLTASITKMDLKLLSPLTNSVCSNVQGTLSGKFHINGSIALPKVHGRGAIQGQMKINYLNTVYHLAGQLHAKDNILHIEQLRLHDGQTGYATFSGNIALQKDLPIFLSGKMKNLHLLHTTRTENSDFYGTLYATGDLQIQGPRKALVLTLNASTDRGTFTIIVHEQNSLEHSTQLVHFSYPEHNQQSDPNLTEHQNQPHVKYMLNLSIGPTVQTKVVFGSYNSHDLIQGIGSGKIQLEASAYSKPYIMGNYIFQSGTCAVSVYHLIQRTFTIAPHSQVAFNGYLQDGITDIHALCTQMASISKHQSIPVKIMLSAYGALANPHIAYDFSFPDQGIAPDLHTKLDSIRSKALLDPHYRNKQILSLFIAKRIYDEHKVTGWDALRVSINDLLMQQIQNLTSAIDHNLTIETDLGISNKQSNLWQETKIRINYALFSEHLKLSSTLGGKHSKLINDWEIAYRLSKLSNMGVKLCQTPVTCGASITNLFGISLTYTKKF